MCTGRTNQRAKGVSRWMQNNVGTVGAFAVRIAAGVQSELFEVLSGLFDGSVWRSLEG